MATDSRAGLTAEETMQVLGIKPQTLYAYASRGFIRKVATLSGVRAYYSREDVERLRRRQLERRAPQSAPSLVSAVSSVTSEGPVYRGHLYRALAVHPGRLENVAELFWTGVRTDESVTWTYPDIPESLPATLNALRGTSGGVPLMRALSAASIALGQSGAAELRDGTTTLLARRAVCTFAGCLGVLGVPRSFVMPAPGESVAALVLRALGSAGTPQELATVNSLLITCADGGLTPAVLAVRLSAATGAGVHACLLAGFGAHSGPELGGLCGLVEDFLHWKIDAQDARYGLLRSGNVAVARTVGLGHPHYPGGDPRGRYLLDLADTLDAPPFCQEMRDIIDTASRKTGLAPSMELGLVTLCLALRLPRRSASALWALGATVGWIAHVIDERTTGTCAAWASSAPRAGGPRRIAAG